MNERRALPKNLKSKVLNLLEQGRQKALSAENMLKALQITGSNMVTFGSFLKQLEEKGLIIKTARNRYGLPQRLGYITGVLEGNRRGFAFLKPDFGAEDIYISAGNLHGAVHGDRVTVLLNSKKNRRRREGAVTSIIKRGSSEIAGTLKKEKKRYFIEPDERRLPFYVQVSAKDLKKAHPGDKVIAAIEKWPQGSRPARGRVIERLGKAGTSKAELLTFKHCYNLPGEFPPLVQKYAGSLAGDEAFSQALKEGTRLDLRNNLLVTIDDETARDFDDAVSLEEAGGIFRLGVHIADVSHYVKQNRPLDREAFKRGTSIYLVEEAIHMLPPVLSENLCSLKAGEERPAISVIMDIDKSGGLMQVKFAPSIIKVTERLTYRQVESFLNGTGGKKAFADQRLPQMVEQMFKLAEILRRQRFARGALDLDLPETKITIDALGVPLAVEKRILGPAEGIIEEFMVYYNETVAGYLNKKKMPCLYRVHAVPTEEKLALLRETLTLMGLEALSNIKVLKAKHLNSLLEKTRGEKTEKLVRYLVLRSLPQAAYSAENEGHFGLASACYCHFTAPIRRYPDLVVHRILKHQLGCEELDEDAFKKLKARLSQIALHASGRERAAVEAERANLDMKKAHFMESKIGKTYAGMISGIAAFGLFVELDNTIEGRIPLEELKDDYYIYNERSAMLSGARGGRRYKLGDEITIKVVGASRQSGQVTFRPVGTV